MMKVAAVHLKRSNGRSQKDLWWLQKEKRWVHHTCVQLEKIKKLELVHSDVWGPANASSLGGSSYYVEMMQPKRHGFIL